MCGKFYYDAAIFSSLEEEDEAEGDTIDQSPGNDVPVYLYYQNRIILTKLNWGYTLHNTNKKVINARSETILEKKLFADDFKHRRGVIAVKGFYQKSYANQQVAFERRDHDTMYLACIYRKKEKEFTILTTAPNKTMQPFHDRMPVIIPKNMVKIWLTDFNNALSLLKREHDDFKPVKGSSQYSIFD